MLQIFVHYLIEFGFTRTNDKDAHTHRVNENGLRKCCDTALSVNCSGLFHLQYPLHNNWVVALTIGTAPVF